MRIRGLLARLVVVGVGWATIAPTVTAGDAGAQAPRPILSLRAAPSVVVLERFHGRVFLDLGITTVAGDEPFEIHLNRKSYAAPIVATWVRGDQRVSLPGLDLEDFQGLPGFYRFVVNRLDGSVAARTRS